jgi:hypothetical protein
MSRTRDYLAVVHQLATHDQRVTQTPGLHDDEATQRFCRFLTERDTILTEYREKIEALRAEQAMKALDLAIEYELEVAPERVAARREAVERIDAALPRIIAEPRPNR